MSFKRCLFLTVIPLLLALFANTSYSVEKEFDGYIVKYKRGITNSIGIKSLCVKGCRFIEKLNIAVVKELPVSFMSTNYRDIEYVEPNWKVRALGVTPSDDLFNKQWGMKIVQAEKAWDLTMGSKEIVVAVIDTGVDYTHSDLKNQMWVNEAELNGKDGVDDDGNGYIDDIHGYDFANKDGDPKDDNNHGTHCAGVIGAAHNGRGVVGINANIKIMALKFLTGSGGGNTSDALSSVMYAVDNGATVLSNSWGGGGSSQAMAEAIEYAKSNGVIFVAAAGNEYNNNDAKPTYPAGYRISNVISVAASTPADTKASFSNFGATTVHIAAPGTNIMSSITGNSYASYDGTSMACPLVAGALALLASYEDLSVSEAKERLMKTSDYIPALEEKTINAGRLNVFNMLTNTIPNRPLPSDPTKWVKKTMSDFNTKHPYVDSREYKFEIVLPKGAKFFRIHFTKFETEVKYDKLTITAGSRTTEYHGVLGEFTTREIRVEGLEKVQVKFKSDRSQTAWGFDADYFEFQ